jgi:hypothetical protein
MLDPLILEASNQPVAQVEPLAPLPAEPQRKPPVKTKRNHPGRIPIPEHLERVEIELDIPEKQKTCPETGKPLKQIGWEVSEKLEYRPGKLIVNVYKRPTQGVFVLSCLKNNINCLKNILDKPLPIRYRNSPMTFYSWGNSVEPIRSPCPARPGP